MPKKTIKAKAILRNGGVTGYVIEFLSKDNIAYVIYSKMETILDMYPPSAYTVIIIGSINENEFSNLLLNW